MHTHPGVCVSFFPPAPALEPARPTDDVRPMFGLVCGNSRRRLAISAATSRFIPCLSGAAHALLRILRPHASLFIIHHRGPQCNEKAALGVIFLLKLVFYAAEARRERESAPPWRAGNGETGRVQRGGPWVCGFETQKRPRSGWRAKSASVKERAPNLIPFPDRVHTSSAHFNYTSLLHVLQPLSSV